MKEKIIKIMLGWVENNEPIETTADKILGLFAVISSVCDCNRWHDRMEESNNKCSACDKPIK